MPPLSTSDLRSRSRCPVTGLPIQHRVDWQDIPLTGDYTVSFCVIGDHILHVTPVGNAGRVGVPRLYEKRQEVLREAGLQGEPYCEIKDYAGVDLHHPRRGRVQFANRLQAEYDDGTLQGFWGYGGPRVFRWIMAANKSLVSRSSAHVYFVSDYREAIRQATSVLQDVPSADADHGANHTNDWSLSLDGFRVRFEVLEDGIVVHHAAGHMRQRHVRPYFALLERVLAETDRPVGELVQINRDDDLRQIDWLALRAYYQRLLAFHRQRGCLGIVACCTSRPVAAAARLGGLMFPFTFTAAPTFEQALSKARSLRQKTPSGGRWPWSILPGRPRDPSLEHQVRDLVYYAGEIDWNAKGVVDPPEDPDVDNPLAPVYALLRVLKHDFDTVLEEREAMQAQVLQAAKLSSLATLTAGVAHELNSPLTAVFGYAEFLRERVEDADAERSAARIQKCARRMRDIIDQLSVFSRGGATGAAELLDVNAGLQEACALLEPLLERNKVKLELSLSPKLPPVWCNRGHFYSVIHNVLINACGAYQVPDDGTRETIWLTTDNDADWVRIHCEDRGSGMSAEVQAHAFDPFFTTKDIGAGTGLGLFVSHRLVSDYDGRIHLRSKEGAGTTVHIEFPAAAGSQMA